MTKIHIFKKYKIVLAGILLTGCATQPIATSAAKPVPTERILNSAYLQHAPNTGEVTVKRDTGMTGSGCAKKVFADAKPVAELDPGEKVVMYLPEGDHIISAISNNPCGGGMIETRVSVKTGGSYTYRIGTQSSMGDGIYPTAF